MLDFQSACFLSKSEYLSVCSQLMGRWTGEWMFQYKDSSVYEIKLLLSFYTVGVWNMTLISLGVSIRSVGQLPMKKRKPWHCASTVQQQPKHLCVINASLATNPKHRTLQAAVKKVNSIPARPSTGSFRPSMSLLHYEVKCITQSQSPCILLFLYLCV